MKKWNFKHIGMVCTLGLFCFEVSAVYMPVLPSGIRSVKAKDVEDNGGFEKSYYIEGDYSEEEGPKEIDATESQRMGISQEDFQAGHASYWGPVNFEDAIVRVDDGKEKRCSVVTKPCEFPKWGRLENIEIIINKNHQYKVNSKKVKYLAQPQTITIMADIGGGSWMTLLEDIVSTGKGREYDTPVGSFRLANNNWGRLKETRNHCSGVADYGSDQGNFVELAPMPYAVHFNGGIALHAGNTTGKPESHGCIRQKKEVARQTYCMLLEEDNWKRATVIVQDF